MTARRAFGIALVIVTLAAAAYAMIVAVPRRYAPTAEPAPTPAPVSATADSARKITATLYYISEDGLSLVGVTRDIPFGEPVVEQARHIMEAQLGAPPATLAAAIPAGTRLRSLFIGERGEAFVDISGEVSARHTGGTLDELFTVYSIVNALTVNLPAITHVQILIDGQEADTLAGHVDLRHPLQKNLTWIRQ